MLDLSLGTALILLALAVAVIVLTHMAKRLKFWKSSVATIPSACLVAMGIMFVFEIFGDPPFTIADAGVIIIVGMLVGGAAAGLHHGIEKLIVGLKKVLQI